MAGAPVFEGGPLTAMRLPGCVCLSAGAAHARRPSPWYCAAIALDADRRVRRADRHISAAATTIHELARFVGRIWTGRRNQCRTRRTCIWMGLWPAISVFDRDRAHGRRSGRERPDI